MTDPAHRKFIKSDVPVEWTDPLGNKTIWPALTVFESVGDMLMVRDHTQEIVAVFSLGGGRVPTIDESGRVVQMKADADFWKNP